MRRTPRASSGSGGMSRKTMQGGIGLVIFLALVGFKVKGEMDGKKYQSFNDAVVNAYEGGGDDPIDTLAEAWSEGQPFERSRLQEAYDASMASVEAVEKKLKAIDVPSKASAQEFYRKATAFAALKREMLETAYRPLIGMLSNSATTKTQVDAHMESTLGSIAPRVVDALMAADEAQKRFAKDVGLELR